HHQPAEQVARGAPAQAGSGLGLRLDAELHPAVRLAALGGLVAADGTVRPIPARLEASGVDLLLDEVGADGLGAGEGEAAVELGASAAVGVPLHQDRALVGVRPDDLGDLVEQLVGARQDGGPAGVEEALLLDFELRLRDHHQLLPGLRAPPVRVGTGDLRAVVAVIGHAVLVGIGGGATAALSGAGLVRTGVLASLHAVAIAVTDGAAIALLEPGLVGAGVLPVLDAVTIAIADGAAIALQETRLVRTRIPSVLHPITIPVGNGAA